MTANRIFTMLMLVAVGFFLYFITYEDAHVGSGNGAVSRPSARPSTDDDLVSESGTEQRFSMDEYASVELTQAVNSAFRVPGQSELNRVEPIVHDKYFSAGIPSSYLRHRVLVIDFETLKGQLENQLVADESDSARETVSIPLFDDVVAHIETNAWIRGEFGVTTAFGDLVIGSGIEGKANFNFIKDGGLLAGLNTPDLAYLISPVSEETYFIVIEKQYVDRLD